jgi:hypothetical protein
VWTYVSSNVFENVAECSNHVPVLSHNTAATLIDHYDERGVRHL